jgi:small subunit ribosomal protein S21
LDGRSVSVRDGNVDKALRKLKKKVNNSGVLLETRRKQEYEKPTTARKLAKNAAKKRWQKYLAVQKLPNKDY